YARTLHLSLHFIVSFLTSIYSLSLHDALPISSLPLIIVIFLIWYFGASGLILKRSRKIGGIAQKIAGGLLLIIGIQDTLTYWIRSEEHTSELQSRFDIVCRLLLETKNDSTQAR